MGDVHTSDNTVLGTDTLRVSSTCLLDHRGTQSLADAGNNARTLKDKNNDTGMRGNHAQKRGIEALALVLGIVLLGKLHRHHGRIENKELSIRKMHKKVKGLQTSLTTRNTVRLDENKRTLSRHDYKH